MHTVCVIHLHVEIIHLNSVLKEKQLRPNFCVQYFTWDYAILLVGIYTCILLDVLGLAGGFNFKIGLAVEPDEIVVVLLAGSTFLFFLGVSLFILGMSGNVGGLQSLEWVWPQAGLASCHHL